MPSRGCRSWAPAFAGEAMLSFRLHQHCTIRRYWRDSPRLPISRAAAPAGRRRMNYLHTMIRVSDPEATVKFFELLGLKEVRRFDNEKGRFTLIFLATEDDRQI